MDRIGNPKRDNNNNKQRLLLKKKKSSEKQSALKVVYISSPMKVKTRASNFRALVQELTGKESDVVKLMDFDNHNHYDDEGFKWADDFDHVAAAGTGHVSYYDPHEIAKSGVAGDLDLADLESPTSTTSSSLSGSGSGLGSGSGSVVFDNQTFDDLITVPNVFDVVSCDDGMLFPDSAFLYESFSVADFVRNYDFM